MPEQPGCFLGGCLLGWQEAGTYWRGSAVSSSQVGLWKEAFAAQAFCLPLQRPESPWTWPFRGFLQSRLLGQGQGCVLGLTRQRPQADVRPASRELAAGDLREF